MDYQTLDESQNSLPAEAIKEIKTMSKWMTFTGVMTIIFAILSILGNLGNYTSTGQGIFLLSIVMNCVSIYLGFIILKKSNLFEAYSDNHEDGKLAAALNQNRIYWMVATLILIVSFLISFINR